MPTGSTEQERDEFLKMLHGLVRDSCAVISDNGSIELLETKTGGALPHEPIVRWADREMSKAFLGETLSTEQTDQGGTMALGKVHNDVRLELTTDDCAMVEATFNTLLKWIWELNWPQDPEAPWFQFAQPKDMQTGELERDRKLHGLGVRFTEKHFVELYGISPDHIAEISNAQAGPMFAEGGGGKPAKGSPRKAARAAAEIVREISEDDFQEQIEEMARPVIALCESCGSYEEFERALLEIAPSIPTGKLEEAIQKCMMIAEAKGAMDA
jgi:phage gp29-like protein